jgi:FAD binding domain
VSSNICASNVFLTFISHTPFAGAANIDGGITLDLSNLNAVNVSADQSQVSLGPGNRWVDVYSKLDQLGVATTGGRVASVGVGGLILGGKYIVNHICHYPKFLTGGISFFSPRYGFVCDNVVNYQIVLASGQLVSVNANSNPDLFKALKGGSNNFGVVVRIDMKLFKQGPFWGGFKGFLVSDREKQFQYFQDFAKSSTYDPYSALIMSYSWTPSGGWINANNFEYTKPVANPPAFAEFNSLNSTFSTMRIDNLTSFAQELEGSNPAGQRELFVTMTFQNSAKMLSTFFNLSDAAVSSLPSDPQLQFSISFQPVPQEIISKGAGTNSLGLDSSDGDLTNVLLTVQWQNAANDNTIYATAQRLFSQATASAQSLGVYNPYLYLNYAASWQNPIASYGAASVSSLQAASKKYDPNGVFQKVVPGGFKLGI